MNINKFFFIFLGFLFIPLIVSASPLPNVIGVFWNKALSSPQLTYINSDNSTASFSPSIANSTYPWSQMGRVNNSLTQYQTMVYVPPFAYYTTYSGNNHQFFIYTQYPIGISLPSGFKIHPAFYVNNTIINGFYIGAFDGSAYITVSSSYNTGDFSGVNKATDKLSSVANVQPISGNNNSFTIIDMRELAENRGIGFEQETYNQWAAIQLLYTIEYGNFNIQNQIGAGVTQITDYAGYNLAMPNGLTAGIGANSSNLGNYTGQISTVHWYTYQNTYPMSYRGIENLYGNIRNFVDGINLQNAISFISSYEYQSNVFTNQYVNSNVSLSTGIDYINNISYSSFPLDYSFLGANVGGSSSTYLCDYSWINSGNKVIFGSGDWNDAGAAGLFFTYGTYTSANADRSVGARLSFVNPLYPNFTYTNTALIYSFTDTSYVISTVTGLISSSTSWNWSFGDGNISSLQNPTHTFSSVGIYNVNLTIGYSTTNVSLVVPIITGLVNVNVSCNNQTQSSFTCNFDKNVTQLSLNGQLISNYDSYTGYYIANNLNANTPYTINVYKYAGSTLIGKGTNTTYTLPIVQSNQENFFSILLPYLIFLIIVMFCAIGLYVDFVGLIGSVIAIQQLLSNVSNGSFIIDVLYFILILVGLMSCAGVFT